MIVGNFGNGRVPASQRHVAPSDRCNINKEKAKKKYESNMHTPYHV